MVRRIVLACLCAAAAIFTVIAPSMGASAATKAASATTSNSSWHHAPLIYHAAGRTQRQWEQHLMQVNAAGQFTGKWLFDAVILTTQDVDSQDIMYAALTGTNLSDLLTQEFADAAALNSAAAALAAGYGAPPKPIQVAITLPWLNPAETSVTLPGASTAQNLSVAAQRMSVATWYLQQVQSMARAANWSQLSLYGIYYQREDAAAAEGDPAYIAVDEHPGAFPRPFHHLGALLRRPGRVQRRQPRFHRHRHPARILLPRRPVRRHRERFPAVQHRLESRRAGPGVGI